MKRYKLIANPASGSGRTRRVTARVVDLLGRRNIPFDLEFTTAPQQAAEIAARSCDDHDAVVAIGGDGTIHEIAGSMLRCEKPLGIIPAGSGNDFVKSLRVPTDTEEAVKVLLAGKTRTIDVGTINGRCFVNVVGIGFDAAVNHNSHVLRWPSRGILKYLIALIKTIGTYHAVPLAVSIDGLQTDGDLYLLTIGNGSVCGGGFKLTPQATLDDGLLDVTMVRPFSVPALLRYFPRLFDGTIGRVTRYVSLKTAMKIRIESRGSLPIHVDGEIYREDTSVIEIEIAPCALSVIGNF